MNQLPKTRKKTITKMKLKAQSHRTFLNVIVIVKRSFIILDVQMLNVFVVENVVIGVDIVINQRKHSNLRNGIYWSQILNLRKLHWRIRIINELIKCKKIKNIFN